MSEFSIKKKKDSKVEEKTVVYTFFGKHDLEDEGGYPLLDMSDIDIDNILKDPEVCAVKTMQRGVNKYYVKRGKYGHLFNPIGIYSENTQYKQERHAGKPLWTLRLATKKVFEYYINFLKTKNIAWLNNAEREV